MQACANIIVQGVVQGVGYRYFTEHHAIKLGLTGYARNLYTGEVEVEVEGDRSLIEELISVLKVGPRSGRVTNLIVNWKPPEGNYHSFEITG